MGTTDFSGREVVKVLRRHRYRIVGRNGSHVQRRYVHPETGAVRNVTVSQYERIDESILRNVADQCGADDFEEWCR